VEVVKRDALGEIFDREGFRVRRINDSNPNAWFNISSAAWGALMTTNEGERLCRVAKMPGGYTVTFSCRVVGKAALDQKFEWEPDMYPRRSSIAERIPTQAARGIHRSLCWGTHYRTVEFTQQLMKNQEIWWRCGLSADAKWMRGVIEQLIKQEFFDSQ